MKQGIHPKYDFVVFHDASGDKKFLTRSTIKSTKTIKWEDGNEYPMVTVDISSYSHPFYTGKQKLLDAAGRVERFGKRFQKTEGKAVKRKAQKQKRIAKAPAKPKGKVLSSTPLGKAKDKKKATKKDK